MALKLSCVNESLQKLLPKLLTKANPTAIPLILIPEYGQSNATLVKVSPKLSLRMVYYSMSDTAILGKTKSECRYQESNLRPSDY